jgi:hypothetical protein
VLAAHTCNPIYSGGRDREDRGSESAWENSLSDPTSKIPYTKKDWWSDSCGRAPAYYAQSPAKKQIK